MSNDRIKNFKNYGKDNDVSYLSHSLLIQTYYKSYKTF